MPSGGGAGGRPWPRSTQFTPAVYPGLGDLGCLNIAYELEINRSPTALRRSKQRSFPTGMDAQIILRRSGQTMILDTDFLEHLWYSLVLEWRRKS